LNKSYVPDLDLTHVDESVLAELQEESEKDTAADSEKQLSERQEAEEMFEGGESREESKRNAG
jgi:hypothetical protein